MMQHTRLNKMRGLLPDAEKIIQLCKEIELTLGAETPEQTIPKEFSRDIRRRGTRLAHRLDLMGVPVRTYGASGEGFPEGTKTVAFLSAEAWVALEVAGSAIVGVGDLERAAVKSMGLAVPNS